MAKKRSVKKHLHAGSLIRTSDGQMYEVTELKPKKFRAKCISVEYHIGDEQEFYYSVDMEVYNLSGKNY